MTFHSLTDLAHLGAQSYFAARQSLHDPRRSCVIGPPRALWDIDAREFLSVVPIQVRERDKKERLNGNRNFEGAECSLLDEMYLPWFRITVGTTRAAEGSDYDVSRLVQKKRPLPLDHKSRRSNVRQVFREAKGRIENLRISIIMRN